MKKLMLFVVTAALMAACADDNPPVIVDEDTLVTPKLYATVGNGDNTRSPLTGILSIIPCQPNSAIYYGNYLNGQLTVLYGYYNVKNGDFYDDAYNREISLPAGPYNMVYWGTPKYEEPTYATPSVREPVYVIGSDMSKQTFSMLKMGMDTTYYPVFDMVYAVKAANIGSENLNAALNRVVAGLKVIVKDKDNGILSSSIDSMYVHISGISTALNFYTGKPVTTTGTVAFPLVSSTDGTQMSNATVMLFPSIGKPVFKLFIALKNGTVKTFQQTLEAPMTANSKLTLTLTLGDIFSEESTGNFTIENWEESTQTIDIPILN